MVQGYEEHPDKRKTWMAEKARMSMNEWWRQRMETVAMLRETTPLGHMCRGVLLSGTSPKLEMTLRRGGRKAVWKQEVVRARQ